MNREEFIEELVNLYDDFTEKNIKNRQRAYMTVLPETLEGGTYDDIFKKLLENYESFCYAPTPAYLVKLLPKKYNPYYNQSIDEERYRRQYGK